MQITVLKIIIDFFSINSFILQIQKNLLPVVIISAYVKYCFMQKCKCLETLRIVF